MGKNIYLRVATPKDAAALLAIYAPYVTDTSISFDYEVPREEVFAARIANTLQHYPFIVAESEGMLLGYAYTGPFVGRAAYAWSAETTIYLHQAHHGLGLGRRLYAALEGISRTQNILNLNACIGVPETDDEYLTHNSVNFHAHLGFDTVGTFHRSGYKFGRWYNMVWMEKIIGSHSTEPASVRSFPELSRETLQQLGLRASV